MSEHIPHTIIKTLFQKDKLKDFKKQNQHWRECHRCSAILDVLQNTLTPSREIPSKPRLSSHPSYAEISETLSKTFDDSLPREQAIDFATHLKSCALCYEIVGRIVAQSLDPLPATVEDNLSAHAGISLSKIVFAKYPPKVAAPSPVQPHKKIKKTETWIDKLLDFVPVPVPVVVMLALILFLGVPSGVYVVMHYQQDSIWERYVYDDRPPHEYRGEATFRGLETSPTHSSLQRDFERIFKTAIASYMIQDYEESITEFESLQPVVQSILSGRDSVNFKNIQNFYFYLGVSHWAMATSKKHNLSKKQKADHLDNAIEYLAKAESFAAVHKLDDLNRNRFFLALAYRLEGNENIAIATLRKIEEGGAYFEQAQTIIQNR